MQLFPMLNSAVAAWILQCPWFAIEATTLYVNKSNGYHETPNMLNSEGVQCPPHTLSTQ